MESIRQRGFKHVMVVTHARDMWRADLCFCRLGAEVIPAPCGAESARLWGSVDETWIPSSTALGHLDWAVKESIALLLVPREMEIRGF